MKFTVGDKVAYSRSFMQSIGAYSGEIPAMRGIVQGLYKAPRGSKRKFVYVLWEGDDEQKLVAEGALTKITTKQGIIDR
jgi:hypothetical protein